MNVSELTNRITPWRVARVLWVFAFMFMLYEYVWGRYTILPDKQIGVRSTPYKFFLVDEWDKSVVMDQPIVFLARRMEPVFPDDQLVVKFVRGLPGEPVRVQNGQVRVADREQDPIPPQQAHNLNKPLRSYDADYVIPESSFFAMGTHPRSYDSRYWGVVHETEIVGRAIPIY